MKTLWKFAACIFLLSLTVKAYPAPQTEQAQLELIELNQMDTENLKAFMEGRAPKVILKVNSSEELLLNFALKGDLFEMDVDVQNPLTVQVKQDLYIRNDNGKFLFSTTPSSWKTLNKFAKGTASVGLYTKDGKPVVVIEGDINERN